MDIDEFKCSVKECYKMAEVECVCKIKNMFCYIHYKPHKSLNRCKFEFIDKKILLKKAMLVRNAFNNLKSKINTLSLAEVGKVNAFLRENYNFIRHEKFQIRISSDNTESQYCIITFSIEFSNKCRDKRYFISNAKYLLSVNGESEKNKLAEVDNELNQLTIDIELSKRKLKNLQVEIKDKEKLVHIKQYWEKQHLYVNILCNLESAEFEEKDITRKIEYLVQQGYEMIKGLFVEQNEDFKAIKISMTNRTEYIFLCKF